MGNSICQRVLSKDEKFISEIWKNEYNEIMGSKLLLSSRLPEVVLKNINKSANNKIKDKVLGKLTNTAQLPTQTSIKDYTRIIKQLYDVRSQIPPGKLKTYILRSAGPSNGSDTFSSAPEAEGVIG